MRIAAAILLAALFLTGCASEEKKAEAASKPAEPISVQTVVAQTRLVDKTLSITGSLIPDETVSVSSEVPGRITSISVDFGRRVKKGEVIAELDKRELNFAVQRAQASLAQALARLGLNPDQEDVRPENTPSSRQAQAQMEDARSKFENASQLVKTGDISQERFTEIQKYFQARQAVYEASKDETRTLLAQVQALKSEVSLARKRLSDATLRAPFDGSVSERLASPGQYMKENTPIVTIVKTDPMRLRMDVPENATGAIRVGSTLTFTTDAAPGSEFRAVVRELNPSLESKSRTLTAEARLTSKDPRLRPGMFVQVRLVVSKRNETVVVPKSAIYSVAGLTKLFVIQNGRAVERRITPGQEIGDWIEVPGDAVNPGDSVAVTQLGQLIGGTPVTAVPKG
jgi:RND family efflux transporter MFP subunit